MSERGKGNRRDEGVPRRCEGHKSGFRCTSRTVERLQGGVLHGRRWSESVGSSARPRAEGRRSGARAVFDGGRCDERDCELCRESSLAQRVSLSGGKWTPCCSLALLVYNHRPAPPLLSRVAPLRNNPSNHVQGPGTRAQKGPPSPPLCLPRVPLSRSLVLALAPISASAPLDSGTSRSTGPREDQSPRASATIPAAHLPPCVHTDKR